MCDFKVIGVPSRLKFTRKTATLERMFPTLDLRCEENIGNTIDKKLLSPINKICLVMFVTKRDIWESTSQGRVMCEHY